MDDLLALIEIIVPESSVNGLSVRFEVLEGAAISLAYEAVAAETKCYALVDQVLDKSVLVIAMSGDPCDTVRSGSLKVSYSLPGTGITAVR